MFPPSHRIYCECQQPHCPHCNGSTLELPDSILLQILLKNKKMKLAKALKEKKRLASEIAHLKNKINTKNSFIKESNVKDKFDVNKLYEDLLNKIESLVNLKVAIYDANKEIQSKIYLMSEYKSLISFLNILNTNEGIVEKRFEQVALEYEVQIDEIEKDRLIKEYQTKVDLLQDEIDTYNHTTEILLDNEPPTEEDIEKNLKNIKIIKRKEK